METQNNITPLQVQPPSQSQPQPMHRKRNIVLGILGTIVGLAVVLVIVIILTPTLLNTLWGKDDTLADDSDLAWRQISVPDQQNSYFDLAKINNIYPGPSSDFLISTADKQTLPNDTVIKEVLNQNSVPLRDFEDAAAKSSFQVPIWSTPTSIVINGPLIAMNTWRDAARLAIIKALYLSEHGQSKAAMDEALGVVWVGNQIEASQSPLITQLVGMGIEDLGLKTMQTIYPTAQLSATDKIYYLNLLNQLNDGKQGLASAFKGEYLAQKDGIEKIANGTITQDGEPAEVADLPKSIKGSYYFKPNQTNNIFAAKIRNDIAQIPNACSANSTDATSLVPNFKPALYITENAVGKLLGSVVLVSLNSVFTHRCAEDQLLSKTKDMLSAR